MATIDTRLYTLIDEDHLDRLPKVYKVYTGTALKEEYKTYNGSTVGELCLKYTYSYRGTTVTGEIADIVPWTQIMEDEANMVVGEFLSTTSTNFDGVNDYIAMGNDAHGYDFNNAFSFSLWVKPDNFGANRVLLSKSSAGVKGYMFRVNSSGKIFFQFRCLTVTRTHEFDQILTVGAWNHIVVTHSGASDASGTSCYVNGVVNASAPSGSLSTWIQPDTPFYLGTRSLSFIFLGNLDEVSVWDKELTQTEVDILCNTGAPDSLALVPSYATSCVSHYRMGENDIFPIIADVIGGVNGTMTNMDSEDFEDDSP
jgi:hypothetical protein